MKGIINYLQRRNASDTKLNRQFTLNTPRAITHYLQRSREYRGISLPPITLPDTSNIKRASDREKENYEIGQKVEGYTLIDKFDIERRKWRVFKFQHDQTGAEHVHISNEEKNNVFSVVFKTTPMDSTGVAHILEHTTLCGSQRYPVRDPFFNMIKRSLNTYMNAWTGGDFTAYPFSTCNEKDYYNLLSVYLDAAFFPLLTENDFKQEGHRLHYTPENGKLEIKGVVYNEMKGAMSESASIIHQSLQSVLFDSSSTYHYNSGGDPSVIPSLTYSQLLSFHSTYYHPSNARFFTFGDLPIDVTLRTIHSTALTHFNRNFAIATHSAVPSSAAVAAETTIRLPIPPLPSLPPSRSFSASVAYVMNDVTDSYQTFLMHFLSELLLSGPTSAFYQARNKRGNFGLDYSSLCGYHPNTKQTLFIVGMDGLSEPEVEIFFDMVNRTFFFLTLPPLRTSGRGSMNLQRGAEFDVLLLESEKNVRAEDIFSPENISALLHQIELSQKNISANYGMNVLSGMISSWIHDGSIREVLDLDTHIARLKKDLADDPAFFQKLIATSFLDNRGKVKMVNYPDEEYMSKLNESEEEKLAEIQRKITEKQMEDIISSAHALNFHQSAAPQADLLPQVRVDDVAKKVEEANYEVKLVGEQKQSLQKSVQTTNDISYVKLIANINDLDPSLVRFIPLFCECLAKMSTKKLAYDLLARKIKSSTGGFAVTPLSHSRFISEEKGGEEEKAVMISSMALNNNVDTLFELFSDIFFTHSFADTKRFINLLSSMTAEMSESMVADGHRFALSLAKSKLTREAHFNEVWYGVTQLKQLQSYLDTPELHSDIISALHRIGEHMSQKGTARMNVISTADSIDRVESLATSFLSSLSPPHSAPNVGQNPIKGGSHYHFVRIQSNINFVARSIYSADIFSDDYPKLLVLCNIISQNYIHQEVREKGGAYGGGVSPSSKLINFYSYRDPNFEKTVDTFRHTLNWLRSVSITDQMIEEAKLMVFQSIDLPKVPADAGSHFFLSGLTREKRQRIRDIILNVGKSELLEVAEKYFGESTESIAVFGSEETKVPSVYYVEDMTQMEESEEYLEEKERIENRFR